MTYRLCHWSKKEKDSLIQKVFTGEMCKFPLIVLCGQRETFHVVTERNMAEGKEYGRKYDVMLKAAVVFSQETCQCILGGAQCPHFTPFDKAFPN